MVNNQAPLRVLIATPAAGSMITLQYFLSFIQTYSQALKSNQQNPHKRPLDVGLYTLGQESLISRGRDHCAAVAMYQKWDKLFFIDADQGWTFEQFETIARSDKEIIGGVSPIKTLPIALNFLPKDTDEHYYKDRLRSYDSLLAMRKGHGQAEINVGYIGTGFLCIDVHKVLMKLAEHAEPFRYPNPSTGRLQTHWQFFRTRPIKGMCQSEDWGFLSFAREHGIEPWINADVCVTHSGTYCFDARMSTDPKLLEAHSEFLKSSQQRDVKA